MNNEKKLKGRDLINIGIYGAIYFVILFAVAKGYAPQPIDQKELHLLLSAYTTAMFEPVVHEYTQEEAYRCLEILEAFFLPGWKQLLGL